MALTTLPTAPSYVADSPLAVLLDLAAQAAGPGEDEQRDDAQTAAAHHIYQAYTHTFAAVPNTSIRAASLACEVARQSGLAGASRGGDIQGLDDYPTLGGRVAEALDYAGRPIAEGTEVLYYDDKAGSLMVADVVHVGSGQLVLKKKDGFFITLEAGRYRSGKQGASHYPQVTTTTVRIIVQRRR